MRTRAKQKHVASDRARRENVPRHILFYGFCSRHLFTYGVQITGVHAYVPRNEASPEYVTIYLAIHVHLKV